MRRSLIYALGAALIVAGCANAGEERVLSVSATGIVKGLVYFDANGDGLPGQGDDSVRNFRVRLVTLNGRDTVASGLSLTTGGFRLTGVPVGTYLVVPDVTPLVDTAVIADQDSLQVTVLPGDSVFAFIGVSYPHVSIRAARTTVPVGRRVFIKGIVLNPTNNFSDTTMHVQDSSAAIRMTRVIATGAQTADTVRLRGTTGTLDGQRILQFVTVFPVTASFLPPATTVTTAQAASAVGGTRDAQQLRVVNASITDTALVGDGFRLQVQDTLGGSLEVLLDAAWFPVQNPRGPGFPFVPGNRFDILGLAVPTLTPGVWRLKPRSQAELVRRLP